MSTPRHLSWENFHSTIWHEGQQRSHRIGRTPSVEIFADAVNGRIGLLIELPAKEVIPKEVDRLVLIQSKVLMLNGRHYLELAATTQTLQRQFYQFATAVADRIFLENERPIPAVVSEVKCFDELLSPRSLLSNERQIGLAGELIVLERLVLSRGSGAVDAWTGPRKEPHDFRIGKLELEVKTSTGTRRIHRIHGLEQLFPSLGMKLSLISILIEPAGKAQGFTLASQIAKIFRLISPHVSRSEQFSDNLNKIGWRESDSKHYTKVWRLRRPVVAVPVQAGFPRLGRQSINVAVGSVSSRIDFVEYDVNVENMGHDEKSSRFPADLLLQPPKHV